MAKGRMGMDQSGMVGLPGGNTRYDESKAIPFSIKHLFAFDYYFYSQQADRQKRLLRRMYHSKGSITNTTCKLIAGTKLKFSFKFVLFQ